MEINKIIEINGSSDFNFVILTDDLKRANDIVVQLKLTNFFIFGKVSRLELETNVSAIFGPTNPLNITRWVLDGLHQAGT